MCNRARASSSKTRFDEELEEKTQVSQTFEDGSDRIPEGSQPKVSAKRF